MIKMQPSVNEVLNETVKIIIFIKLRPINSRLFKRFGKKEKFVLNHSKIEYSFPVTKRIKLRELKTNIASDIENEFDAHRLRLRIV